MRDETRIPDRVERLPSVVPQRIDTEGILTALQRLGSPVATTRELAAVLEGPADELEAVLVDLSDAGTIGRKTVRGELDLWYPVEWDELLAGKRVVTFADRQEFVLDQPDQFTRAQAAQFAELTATNGSGAYWYRIRPIDVWHAPADDFDALMRTVRDVIPAPDERLVEWIRDQWERGHRFRLYTHPDDYTVLEAGSASLMGNVARPALEDGELRGPISETESWVAEGREADIKRVLLDEGFPVQDDRELEEGDPLAVELTVSLRPYQREWVDAFMERGAGVLVGPPGSGKTVTALGIMATIGGESLILVPSRELATQWRTRILADTDLDPDQVGEYHGGVKQRRPVTIATYHVAGMDRHRSLFEDRKWGLIVFDECHHIPAPVARRTAELQSRHRLGLSSSPVRGDDKEGEIFTLIGQPIGTDWAALLEAGFVMEPTLEIRYLPWGAEEAAATYQAADGHERRRAAAMNPAKLGEIERLRARHPDDGILIFVEWIDHGEAIAADLDVPFVSGQTPHPARERFFEDFRNGRLQTLVVSRVGDEGVDLPDASVAIIASGLGGSRRQGTQRVGRTMRPVGGAHCYLLATSGTEEEDFARHQLRYLRGKGMRVEELTVELDAVDATTTSSSDGG